MSTLDDATCWWTTTWPEVVNTLTTVGEPLTMPHMRLLRGVPSDAVYQFLAPAMARLEAADRKAETTRIRRWAQDLMLGLSTSAPPWPHIALAPSVVGDFADDLAVRGSQVATQAQRHRLSWLAWAYRKGAPWEPFARQVLAFLPPPDGTVDLASAPPVDVVHQLAAADLRAALDLAEASLSAWALERLGWPSPWRPHLETMK